MSSQITVEGFDEAERLMETLAGELRTKISERALRKATGIVKKAARATAPDSRVTGSSDLKSKSKRRDTHLKDNIKSKIKRYESTTVGVVGADYSRAPHGHLVEEGHAKVLWGRPSGARVEGKHTFAAAVDQTKAQQQAAIEESLKRDLEETARAAGLK